MCQVAPFLRPSRLRAPGASTMIGPQSIPWGIEGPPLWGGNYYLQEAGPKPVGFSPVVEMVLSAGVRFLADTEVGGCMRFVQPSSLYGLEKPV